MTLRIEEPKGPAALGEITRAEEALGTRLPETYRAFLATVGGGQTDDLDVPGAHGDGVLLEVSGTEGLVKRNVTPRRKGFLANIPDRYIVIGYGGGGAPCLRVKDGDEGSVWWADFEKAGGIVEEEPTEDIMIRLADDFDGFLNLFE